MIVHSLDLCTLSSTANAITFLICSLTSLLSFFFSLFAPTFSFFWLCSYHCKYIFSFLPTKVMYVVTKATFVHWGSKWAWKLREKLDLFQQRSSSKDGQTLLLCVSVLARVCFTDPSQLYFMFCFVFFICLVHCRLTVPSSLRLFSVFPTERVYER